MEKKNIDWSNLGFGYQKTEQRYVSYYKNGAWDEGGLTSDANIVINECAGVLQYAQTVFEGLKAYTTEDGRIVTFRPDLNAERLINSARRLEIPEIPKEKFLDAIDQVVAANAAYVPPYGSGATLYIRPYIFGSNAVIGVKPADEYQFRVFCDSGRSLFQRRHQASHHQGQRFRPCGASAGRATSKPGLNYAMSLHAHRDRPCGTASTKTCIWIPATRTKVEETGGANFIFVTKDNKAGDAAFR